MTFISKSYYKLRLWLRGYCPRHGIEKGYTFCIMGGLTRYCSECDDERDTSKKMQEQRWIREIKDAV